MIKSLICITIFTISLMQVNTNEKLFIHTDFSNEIAEKQQDNSIATQSIINPFDYLYEILNDNLSYSGSAIRLKNYFTNLTTNFGNNQEGTCGYVALASMLTYYDTFWSDIIVPDNLEVSTYGNSIQNVVMNQTSPGSLNENIIYPNVSAIMQEMVYRSAIVPTISYNLHNLLVYQNDSLGTDASDTENIIENFLSTNLKDDFIYLFYYFDDDLSASEKFELTKEYCRTAFTHGIPIKLSIYDYETKSSHAVVAHSLSNNSIECHFGWYSDSTSVPFTYDGYDEIKGLTTFVPKMSHSHSNNYIIQHNNGFSYYYCPCGETIGHTHNNQYQNIDSYQHLKTCTECNEQYLENHIFLSSQSYCVCGATNFLPRPNL